MPTKPAASKSWHDVLPIHPAAELFPRMTPDELKALGEDIKKNGLKIPVAVWRGKGEPLQLLDGRNRLDAMEAVGIPIKRSKSFIDYYLEEPMTWQEASEHISADTDPYAYVVSANIHRRHLTGEQKHELIAKLIETDPTKSNRQIAKTVKVDHKTVASVRAEKEGRGEIPHVETRTDTKGRKQPARKTTTKPPPVSEEVLQKRAAAAERLRALLGKPPKPPDDIGADSGGEADDLRVRVKELQDENCRLKSTVAGLEREIEELRGRLATGTGGDMSFGDFQAAIKKWEGAVEAQRGIIARLENENARLRAASGAPPAHDGLGIPDFSDRTNPKETIQ